MYCSKKRYPVQQKCTRGNVVFDRGQTLYNTYTLFNPILKTQNIQRNTQYVIR